MRPPQARPIKPPHKLDSDRSLKLTRPVYLSVFYQSKVAVSDRMPVREDLREGSHCPLIGCNSFNSVEQNMTLSRWPEMNCVEKHYYLSGRLKFSSYE
jgi:hypothetical protein